MPTEIRYHAVVPAAGVGSRMGASVPKQYLPLAGSTVIDLTLERLLGHPNIETVVVAISPDDGWWPDSKFASDAAVTVVQGGKERCHSVLNALQALRQQVNRNDRVLVHDAARPCVRHEDITRLIQESGQSDNGGLLGVPVKDTMKRTANNYHIEHTLDRDNMWHAFTPQLFPLGSLLSALQQALEKGQIVTDESSAMELAGFHPLMVEGGQDNIKITRPEDLALAGFYLGQQLKN